MRKEIGQFPVYLMEMSLMAIGGALVILFLQLLIFSDVGIVKYFFGIKRLGFLSYYFNLHILLSIIIAPLAETYLMIALMNLFARMGGDGIKICLASAIFWAMLHSVKGASSILPIAWLFFWLSKSALELKVDKRLSFFAPWIIHGIYNILIFMMFNVQY